jgi:hypothetical protein
MDAIKYCCEHWREEIKAPQRAAMLGGNIIEKEAGERSAERQRENIMRWNRIQRERERVYVCLCIHAKSIPQHEIRCQNTSWRVVV